MVTSDDLFQAKQALSARLLRAGLQAGVVGMMPTMRVSSAVAAAGRNVHAVGVGRKVVEGNATDTRCVRLYVVQKISKSLLPPRDRLPQEIGGIPTDIIESAPAFVHARKASDKKRVPAAASASGESCSRNKRKRQRPVVAGISTAHYGVTAGTLAYFCRSTKHGDDPSQVHVLSNNHVFADVNRAQIGDPLYQPGPADGATDTDHYADLHRYVPIHLGGNIPNQCDAAIGSLLEGVEHDLRICELGPITGTAQAIEDMEVRKHGRTTGYTEGVVTDESYDALVGMDHDDTSMVALFENQMRLERIAPYPHIGLGGDSGSLVVMKSESKAVGLYFAGPPSGVYGIADHVQKVLDQLEIELL